MDEIIEKQLCGFQKQAQNVEELTRGLLGTISEGMVPGKEELDLFHSGLDELRIKYEGIFEYAKSVLPEDALPLFGSSVNTIFQAIDDNSRKLTEQLENAKNILTQFIRVKSMISI